MQSVLSGCSDYRTTMRLHYASSLLERHSVGHGAILVDRRLTEFLGMLGAAFLAPGLNAVTSHRSFIVYRWPQRPRALQLIEVPMRQDEIRSGRQSRGRESKTRIIFLANPNNPTGTLVRRIKWIIY